MMTRREWTLLSIFFLAGCSGRAKDPLPEAIGPWKRTSSEPETDVPAVIQALGCKQARRGAYEGPARVEVKVFEMTTSAGAFEALQKWRVAGGTVPFHKDQYFLLITGPDERVNAEFCRSLEKAIGRQ